MLDGMTNIKTREVLKELKVYTEDLPHYSPDEVAEALEMANKALEQGDVLDKIRAEIEETYISIAYQENKDRQASWGLRKALQIIDKYKVESEDTE